MRKGIYFLSELANQDNIVNFDDLLKILFNNKKEW